MSRDDIAAAIARTIRSAVAESGNEAPELTPQTRIDRTLGLDSLGWASVVVQLEEELGFDPFLRGLSRELRTLDDLVDLYAEAAA